MQRYRTVFNDGSAIENEAVNADAAKRAAKAARRQELGPATGQGVADESDPHITVARVEAID